MHRYAMAVLHLAAAGAVLLADLPWPVRGVLWAVIAGHLYYVWPAGGDARIECDDRGALRVQSGDEWREASVLADSAVLPGLIVLRWDGVDDGSRGTLCIWPDSLPREERRRLRVWLRWVSRHDRSDAA